MSYVDDDGGGGGDDDDDDDVIRISCWNIKAKL